MRSSKICKRQLLLTILTAILLTACGGDGTLTAPKSTEHAKPAAEAEVGPHGGRLLSDGDFAIELAIVETGVPPEFRAWASVGGEPLNPAEIDLNVHLTRLGGHVDDIDFTAEKTFLRGNKIVYEPHSFVVTIETRVAGKIHRWSYDNFEGRTRIEPAIAEAFGLQTATAGPAVFAETIDVYGRIEPNSERVRTISARFDGVIQSIHATLGEVVTKGQPLITIESNESLRPYTIKAPIDGVVTERAANPQEQTEGGRLLTIMDTGSVWVDLAIFPADRKRVRVGAPVSVDLAGGHSISTGRIDRINVTASKNQAVTARVTLDNPAGILVPGMYVNAQITVAEYPVPLAVKRTGLQTFRDFTVVYARVDNTYEVRMLDLGRQAGEWVEVLGGIDSGTQYVTTNSYLVKADIEKSGASHDH